MKGQHGRSSLTLLSFKYTTNVSGFPPQFTLKIRPASLEAGIILPLKS